MRGFDLYRITLAYLGLIFVMCAAVVFDPLRWIRPAGDPLVVQDIAVAAPGAADVARTASLPASEPAARPPMQAAPATPATPATPVGPVDPAEVVANLVAQSFAAQFGEDLGEGDVSGQLDAELSAEAVMVANGADVAYTVGPGESLGSLALRFYGDSALSSVIFEANRGLMASPDQLRVGQVVIIPGRS